jgi:hypothetical protein
MSLTDVLLIRLISTDYKNKIMYFTISMNSGYHSRHLKFGSLARRY